MRIALAAAAGLALAGCAPQPEPAPRDARLSGQVLTVTLSDGQRCRGPRPEGAGAAGWSGRLTGCSVAYPYSVRILRDPNPLRQIVEGVFAALEIDDRLAAMAEVSVTGPEGRAYRFASPPPAED